MLTEKQQKKLNHLLEIYKTNYIMLEEITQEKLIEILRKSDWNMTNAINNFKNFYDGIQIERNRILNLPKNVVRLSDSQGYHEIWEKFYKCPNCGKGFLSYGNNFCHECGIKLDWSEIK